MVQFAENLGLPDRPDFGRFDSARYGAFLLQPKVSVVLVVSADVLLMAVNWPVNESLGVWRPESDRGESRLGYQTSGPLKGGPYYFTGCSHCVLSPVARSDKALRVFSIRRRRRCSL